MNDRTLTAILAALLQISRGPDCVAQPKECVKEARDILKAVDRQRAREDVTVDCDPTLFGGEDARPIGGCKCPACERYRDE